MTIGFDDEPKVTIPTSAVRAARAFVDDGIPAASGRSLAIVGDYGAGKSHLASEVTNRLLSQAVPAMVCIIRVRSDDSLYSIYQRIFDLHHADENDEARSSMIRYLDVYRRVSEVRAEIEQERDGSLQPDEILESNRILPEATFSRPGIPALADDLELTRALQYQLLCIVGDREFADGLSLLLHDDEAIAHHAWDWLRGGPVTSDLAKRGVGQPIETETRAMLALTVLARLFNRDGARFALVIDDIERLGGRGEDSHDNLTNALNGLFRWAADTQSILVVCGLARTWQSLPEGVLQRVGQVIYPSPFTKADLAQYQRESYKLAQITDGPRFTKGAYERLLDITAGSPRKAVDAYYHLYQKAGGASLITAPLVDEVGREIFVHTPPSEAAEQIRRFCGRLGRRVITAPIVGETTVQLRIPAGSARPGCSIVITGSVVDAAAATRLIRLAGEHGGDSPEPSPHAAILVCVGQLAESQQARVRDSFIDVLRFDHDEFWPELSALISGPGPAPDSQADAQALRELLEDVRGLRAHQASDHEILIQLADSQDERRLRGVIRDETRRAYLRAPEGGEPLDFGDNYPEVQRVFDVAVSAIREALERVEQLWRSMFQSQEPTRLIDRSKAPGGRAALPSDLTPDPIIRALGVLVALDNSLDSFGRAVISSLYEEAEGRSARQWLVHQCTRFDKTVEALIALIPSADEDVNFTVYRVLGIDRVSLLAKLQRLGASAFDLIYPAGLTSRY